MGNKYTEGLKKVDDSRYRIYEDVYVSKNDLTEIPIKEGTITETSKGNFNTIKSYRMNVWQERAKNKNGRNYDTIFETVLQANSVTLGLMNHPEGDDDGDPKDIWAVQKNPLVENGWLTCQVDLVGEYGKLAEDVLEAGGAICISSSCLGRVNESGQIERQGFLLERYGDWVLNPSNGFNHYKNEMTETTKKVVKENSTILVEDASNNIQTKETNNVMTNEIRNLKLNLKNMIREAVKADSNHEKLNLLGEALEYCEVEELSDLKESIVNKIDKINEAIMNRASEADVLEESMKTKEIEVDKVKEIIATKNNEVSKLKSIAEAIKKSFNKTNLILEKQTELREESENKLVIVERDLADMIKKASILESDLAFALSKVAEAQKTGDEAKDDEAKVKKAKDDEAKDDEAKDDEAKDDEDKTKKDEKKKESVTANVKVRSFYKDSLKSNKSLRENRGEILACSTLKEAQDLVLKLSNKVVKSNVKVQHENVNTKVKTGVKTASAITEKYRKNWNLG